MVPLDSLLEPPQTVIAPIDSVDSTWNNKVDSTWNKYVKAYLDSSSTKLDTAKFYFNNCLEDEIIFGKISREDKECALEKAGMLEKKCQDATTPSPIPPKPKEDTIKTEDTYFPPKIEEDSTQIKEDTIREEQKREPRYDPNDRKSKRSDTKQDTYIPDTIPKTVDNRQDTLREDYDVPKVEEDSKYIKPEEKPIKERELKSIDGEYTLTEMPHTYIEIKSQDECDKAMWIYENASNIYKKECCGEQKGWVWNNGAKATELNVYDGDTFIQVKKKFSQANKRDLIKKDCNGDKKYTASIISFKDFLNYQGLK